MLLVASLLRTGSCPVQLLMWCLPSPGVPHRVPAVPRGASEGPRRPQGCLTGSLLSPQMPHSRRYRSSERSSRGSYHERYRSRKHKRRRTRSRSSSSERDRRHRREDSYHVRSRR